jgi:hypothetical protein
MDGYENSSPYQRDRRPGHLFHRTLQWFLRNDSDTGHAYREHLSYHAERVISGWI